MVEGRQTRRSGFTLLELLVASAITVLLMAAVYAGMEASLNQMEAGRTVVEETAVPRALLARMSNDLTASVGPIVPLSSSSSASSTQSAGAAAATTPATTTTTTTATVNFQIGVKGDASKVAIFQTRLNRGIVNPPQDPNSNTPPAVADIRRVTYFMTAAGLAVQEVLQATADLVDDLPMDADDHTRIIGAEVDSMSLRYYDGTTWQDSWDGSTPGPDGVTPQGPPRSVEITLGIKQSNGSIRTFKHVIAFPTAPGPASTTSQ